MYTKGTEKDEELCRTSKRKGKAGVKICCANAITNTPISYAISDHWKPETEPE
jgi:hypothetical protein